MKKLLAVLALTLLSVTFGTTALAETGFYAGIGVGGSRVDSDAQTNIQYYDFNPLPPPGAPDLNSPVGAPIELDFDEYDAAFKGFVGYRILDWLAVEGGWYYLGEPDGTTSTPDPSTRVETDIELKGWNADVVGFWRFHEQWEAFGKVGVFFWEYDLQSVDRAAASGSQLGPPLLAAVPSGYEEDENSEDLKVGFGLQYLHDDNLALRGEFEYFDVDALEEAWLLSFSALWRFN